MTIRTTIYVERADIEYEARVSFECGDGVIDLDGHEWIGGEPRTPDDRMLTGDEIERARMQVADDVRLIEQRERDEYQAGLDRHHEAIAERELGA